MGDLMSGGQESGYEDLQRALGQGMGQEQQYYQQGLGMLQPYMTGGGSALSAFLSQLGITPTQQVATTQTTQPTSLPGGIRPHSLLGRALFSSMQQQPQTTTTPTTTTAQTATQPTDAQSIIGQIESGFQQTPAQKYEQQQATEAAQNLLESQGIAGSGAAAKSLAQTVSDITGGQEQQYLQNVLGLRQQTLSDLLSAAGLGAGAAGTGAQLAGTTGRSLAQLLGTQGLAQYGEDVSSASGINKMLKSGILSSFL